MTSFGRHTPTESPARTDAEQHKFKFANGYGASVIRGSFSYGGPDGLWELGVLGPDGHLTYDTPITSDVLGHLDEAKVAAALDAIEALSAEGIAEAKAEAARLERAERIAELRAELASLEAEVSA